MRSRHTKKEVEQALRHAEELGWDVEPSERGHRWGVMTCGQGCTIGIWSTPKNPGNFAKQLRRAVARCEHLSIE